VSCVLSEEPESKLKRNEEDETRRISVGRWFAIFTPVVTGSRKRRGIRVVNNKPRLIVDHSLTMGEKSSLSFGYGASSLDCEVEDSPSALTPLGLFILVQSSVV
jgi:hypothetical protein